MASRWKSVRPTPVTLHMVGAGTWTEVPALLCYDPADPFAVRIAFGGGGGGGHDDGTPGDEVGGVEETGVSWLLARDLLREGLQRPAGDGDVRLWPARGDADALYLHLRAPSGEALFELSRAAVQAFLRRTELVVPAGAEVALLDVDAELGALLGDGRAPGTSC